MEASTLGPNVAARATERTCAGTTVYSTCTHRHNMPSLALRTPIRVSRLANLLATHPDKVLTQFVLSGLHNGFDIGFRGPRDTSIISSNLASAYSHTDFVNEQLSISCNKLETAGPFTSPPWSHFRCSGIGVVPKKNGKFRLIHHLSSPEGDSVNDHISAKDYALHYISIDNAIDMIMSIGTTASLSKLDVKSAFRLIPVREQDWPLLGIQWNHQFYFEKVLPFGLRSSPAIFDSFSSAVEWVLRHQFSIPHLLHYLDDFLCVSPNAQLGCRQLGILLRAFTYLGIPLAPHKVEGPSSSLTFLGIVLDCELLEARLPEDKLSELKLLVTAACNVSFLTQRDLESLLGKLSFASRVVVPGRTFTRRLWNLCKSFVKPHHRIMLSPAAKEDLKWWSVLLQSWNGKSFFLQPSWTPSPSLELYTDASGAVGWGAFWNGCWIRGDWSPDHLSMSITWKELYAIVAAATTWGKHWQTLRILFHCDNEAVVACLSSGTSRSPPVMDLLYDLFFVSAQSSFTVSARHVPGKSNAVADSLSRGHLQEFRRLVPTACSVPDKAALPRHTLPSQ